MLHARDNDQKQRSLNAQPTKEGGFPTQDLPTWVDPQSVQLARILAFMPYSSREPRTGGGINEKVRTFH